MRNVGKMSTKNAKKSRAKEKDDTGLTTDVDSHTLKSIKCGSS